MSEEHEFELEECESCKAACPVRTDTRVYVDLIARGRYEEAFEKIRENNPFPSVCSLICHHPCEGECRRSYVDEAVALRNLKRFAVEQALQHRREKRGPVSLTEDESVGIIGSGPAGLTAAHDCIKQGYPVTVYEALPVVGGLLASTIPPYRLPEDALQQDIEDLLSLGIEVETDTRVGEDVSLDELQERHDALLLAVGLSRSRGLPLENSDHPDALLALPFLRAVRLGPQPDVPDRVAVVGGGNVAVDVARSAMRLGATSVKMVCLENEEEMPAWDWECREALEEGIEILHRLGPEKILVEDGDITGLRTKEVKRVFDENGNFSPAYYDDRLDTVDCDMVVLAIGQHADLDFVDEADVLQQSKGRLEFDRSTMSTSREGIFAAGEVVTGPGSAIEAVANGHRAADAVLGYLRTGELQPVEEKEPEPVGELDEEVAENIKRIKRMAMPTLSPEERKRNFAQFELGYGEKEALQEARRCLSCTAGASVEDERCAACVTCMRVCPFGVPAIDDVAFMTSEMCQSCGLCAVECPTRCISIERFYSVGSITERMQNLVEGAEKPVRSVEIVCAQDAESRQELTDRLISVNGHAKARLPVTCAALVDEVDMMKPYELDVSTVAVKRCSECRYHGASNRLSRRVGRTRELLESAGYDGSTLMLE